MATAPQAPRRSMAPPSPPPQAAPAQEADTGQSLYEYALDCIRSLVDPNFPPQGTKEDPHRYFHRIGAALYEMAPEQFEELDPELKTWYDNMAQSVEASQSIEPIPGYYSDEPAQTASAPAAPAEGKKEQPAGLAKWRADQKALKEAQAAGGGAPAAPAASNGHAPPSAPPRRAAPGAPPAQAAAPATPPRRMAPPAPQAPQAPAQQTMPLRRPAPVAPQAPAAPQRRTPAPQQQAPAPAAPAPARRTQATGRQQDVVDDLRRFVLANLDATPDQLRAYAQERGYVQADTTIGAICSAVKAIHGLMVRDGWTMEAPAWYYGE